jgi:hypothetical protein
MKVFVVVGVAALLATSAMAAGQPPEVKACVAGNRAACAKWRIKACRDGVKAACDYDIAQKQSNPSEWCQARYEGGGEYRWCLNGSPDR